MPAIQSGAEVAERTDDSSDLTGLDDDEIASAVLANAPDGVLVSGPSGEIVWVNRRLEEMLGYESGALLGQRVEQLVPDSLRLVHREHRSKYLASPRVRAMGPGIELQARKQNGSELDVEIGLSPVAMSDVTYAVAIVRDISSRREAEHALGEARAALVLGEERHRIARDLHDTVIQRLFATGLSLQGMAAATNSHDVAAQLEDRIDDLDATIRQIRNTIFSLEHRRDMESLRAAVIDAVEAATRSLGFQPAVTFEGPVDSLASPKVGPELVATLREALSNIARHARASHVDIRVEVTPDELLLAVIDDGVGIGEPGSSGSGIANMTSRATELGGACRVAHRREGGTLVEWTVPIAAT